MLGTNSSKYVLYFFKSNKQYSIIFLSDSIPKARITINNGIGFLTLGIFTTICLLVYLVEGLTILIDAVLIGLEESSLTDLISAEQL